LRFSLQLLKALSEVSLKQASVGHAGVVKALFRLSLLTFLDNVESEGEREEVLEKARERERGGA
jgi:hypothetical protein